MGAVGSRAAWVVAGLVASSALGLDPRVPSAVAKAPLFLTAALATLSLGGRRARLTTGNAWLTLTAGWLMLSLAWATHPDPLRFAPLVASPLFALALAGLPREDRLSLAFRVACVACVVAGAAAVIELALGLVPRGVQGNPNWSGLELAVAFPLVWHGARRSETPTCARIFAAAALVFAAAGLALSGSRTAWLATVVALFALERSRVRWLAVALGVAIAVYSGIRGDLGASLLGRVWIARASLAAAIDALPLGTGLGDFPFAFLDAQGTLLERLDVADAATRFSNAVTAHDDVLELFATGGPVALALAVATLLACATVRGRDAPVVRAVILATATGALGDSSLALPLVALALAFATAATPRLPRLPRDAGLVFGALALASVLLVLGVRRYASQVLVADARLEHTTRRAALLERAVLADPGDGEAWLELGIARHEAGDFDGAAAGVEHSLALLANTGTYVALGNAEAHRERTRAIAAYRRALSWHPGSLRARTNLARVLLDDGRLDDAAREVEHCQRLAPTHAKVVDLKEALRRARIDDASN